MIPQPNQQVIIFFRTGIRIEGIVVSWSDQKSVLKTSDATVIVIQKTLDDVMFYKITNAKSVYDVAINKPIKTVEDIKSIANLKIELNELEREEIKEKLTTHVADGMKAVEYGIPGSNIKISGALQRPRKETSRENTGIGSGLQDLFSKKY
jgi:hypothetical protein